MLPGFDLLNHKFGADSTPGFHADETAYVIKSNDVYTQHDQVFISYSDQRNNLQMLMTYGFVAPGNPQQVVLFDVANLLEACAAARPAYFVPAVRQQLWGLMEKLGKQRDLYEWNSDGTPQESLVTAIDMMADIEKQFIKEPDVSFGADVVAALLAARRQELAQGLERIVQFEQEYTDTTWLPMLSSIKLLLQEEETYLGQGGCPSEEAAST